jgi:predicted lipoprotein with Yx(FWY)xxD motif
MLLPAAGAVALLTLAACGSSSTSSISAFSSASITSTVPVTASPPSSSVSSASSSSSAPAVKATVGTGTTSTGTVVTNANGLTLYRFTAEMGTKIACTGGCASTWPPLTVAAGSTVTKPAGLTGTLATVARPDGTMQVTYNGWPLYQYGQDTVPGDIKGDKIAGKWFVVTPDAPPG